ncbi:hypothetical protein F4X33_04660 [Candidatus Poribacteria bacterium]|nr:hypothetical protein [Candidatus Poribacteria bacterium]
MVSGQLETYVREIQGSLKEFATDPVTQEKLDDGRYREKYHTGTYWTPSVMRRMGDVGKRLGFEVYSKFHRGERLYDLCWVEEVDGIGSLPATKSLPLVLECEWDSGSKYRSEVEYDFDKLLWSGAELCVMIFECWSPNQSADTVKGKTQVEIDNLIRRVEAFSGFESTYLFCVHCTYRGGNEFVFQACN